MDDSPKVLGALIAERREALDLTQHGLAVEAGVSPHTVKYIERGWFRTPDEPYSPQRKSLVKLSDVLNIPLGRMLETYGYKAGTRDKVQFTVTGLTPEQVEQVRSLIDDLRKQNRATG